MAYIWEEKHFHLQSAKLITFFLYLFDKDVPQINCNGVSRTPGNM